MSAPKGESDRTVASRSNLGVISECISSRQVTATSIPRMTLGSCLSRTVQPTRFALVCVRVFSVYQQHGQVWSSCQTERLGVLGAGDARTSVDRDAVLLPRSASRLVPGWSRARPLRYR